MAKLGLLALLLGFVGIVGATALSSSQEAQAAAPCKRTAFDTKMVGDACKKGGQAEAKKVMKKFLAKYKKTHAGATCQTCHSKLAPKYLLKADGLQLFKDGGGK